MTLAAFQTRVRRSREEQIDNIQSGLIAFSVAHNDMKIRRFCNFLFPF